MLSGINDVTENTINLSITLKIKALLENDSATIILTRNDENGIYDSSAKTINEKKKSDFKKRVEIGNSSNADIFVSIHLNNIPQPQYYGAQTFFKKNDKLSIKLAQNIQTSLVENIKNNNKRRALVISNKYLMDNIKIPIVTVECGFLSNLEENQLLTTNEYQDKLAYAIYLGIINYFN